MRGRTRQHLQHEVRDELGDVPDHRVGRVVVIHDVVLRRALEPLDVGQEEHVELRAFQPLSRGPDVRTAIPAVVAAVLVGRAVFVAPFATPFADDHVFDESPVHDFSARPRT